MFSPKTKDVPPKRTFLIAFSLIGIGALALSAHAFLIQPTEPSLVKNDVIVASDIAEHDIPEVAQVPPEDDKPVITTYVVKSGDTLSSIAAAFSISTNTLLWANDLTKKSLIKEGQKLTILPVSGIIYTVAKRDTIGGIALKFDVDADEIVSFNDLEENKTVRVGMKLIIPNAELPLEKAPVAAKKVTPKVVEKKEANPLPTESNKPEARAVAPTKDSEPSTGGYFTHPIPGSVLTQGAHGYNSVDFGAPIGTPVVASAGGTVIISKSSGYNGGYGKHIVIKHDNGTQTLYAHLSSVSVSVDDEVTKGQTIALSGNTGRSTGPHLHFEVRGGKNPWVGLKKLTKF